MTRPLLLEMTPRDGRRPPLFWCGLDLDEMTRVARSLPDQPLFLLRSAHDEVQDPKTHVVETAARYLAAIRAVEPEGPYLLGGACLDGFVALEMAARLQQAGQEVKLLVTLERTGPNPAYLRFMRLRSVAARVIRHLSKIARADNARRRAYVGGLAERFARRVTARIGGGTPEAQATAAYGEEEKAVHLAVAAVSAYVAPASYPGRIALIFGELSIRHLPVSLFPAVGWEKIGRGPLTLHVVPGHHESIASEANAPAFAAQLRACVAAAGVR